MELLIVAGLAAFLLWPRGASAAGLPGVGLFGGVAGPPPVAPPSLAGLQVTGAGGKDPTRGAAAGASAGAAVGSAVPVVGTAVGGVVGAIVGALQALGLNDAKRHTSAVANAAAANDKAQEFLRAMVAAGVPQKEAFYVAHGWGWDLMNRMRAGAPPFGSKMYVQHSLMIAYRDAMNRARDELRAAGREVPEVPPVIPGEPPSQPYEPARASAAVAAAAAAAPSIRPSLVNLTPTPPAGGSLIKIRPV